MKKAVTTKLQKIISGGQTGADQGALDGAISQSFPHGGSIPAGRKTEEGMLPETYQMEELVSGNYADRTEKNVRDADATLIVSHGPLTGSSALTMKIARRLNKPCLHVDFKTRAADEAAADVTAWLASCGTGILNVAGPRASSDADIYDAARKLVAAVIEKMR